MAHFRTPKPSNNQWSTFPPRHEFPRVQNSHTNAVNSVQTNAFNHQHNASKFTVNTDNQNILNSFNSSRISALRTPFEASTSEFAKPVNNMSYPLRSPFELQANNFQLNPRFPFPSNQQHYVRAEIPTSVQNSKMFSQNLAAEHHPRHHSLQNMNNFPSNQARLMNSSTNSIVDIQMKNTHDQSMNWHINLPPPPMLPRPPMPIGPNLTTDNNFSNIKNIDKQFSISHLPLPQKVEFSNSSVSNFPPGTSNNFSLPPFVPQMIPSACVQSSNVVNTLPTNCSAQSEKEKLLLSFLNKFSPKQKGPNVQKSNLTVVEFRSALKIALSLLKMLSEAKDNLMELLKSDEDQWNSHAKIALLLKDQLTDVCHMLCNPNNLRHIQYRLLIIKKKRESKKRRKLSLLSLKQEKEKNRKELNQEIDKWFDNIKEKNLDLKRKMEMKKEADSILSEVRRKIHEAKRTIEKLKTFEKLRAARQANAMRKSLIIQPEHNIKFEEKVSVLKKVMLNQLSDYEAEERALKVMLETEQEEQLEQEALWRVKKMKTILQRKQKNIQECLFGDADEPTPADPIYLFYSHHTSANNSISNLVQIRHQWDVYLADDGESIPQQWVVPVPPSSSIWEKFCSG